MRARTLVFAALTALATLPACEKSGGPPTEAELFKSLPSGSIVFGGNFMKLQNFMTNSALGKATTQFAESVSKGMKQWIECFAELKNQTVAGAVSLGKGAELRMAFSGTGIPELIGCANKAGFKTTSDPDGKFVGIDVPGPMGNVTQGYLKLPSGALYTRQAFSLGMMMSVTPATRAELEADIAALSKGAAAEDKKIQELIAKVDHSKTLWFAGSAEGTPAAGKVGELYGSVEISPGIALDLTAQIPDSALAKQIEDGITQMKSAADQLPDDLKAVIKGLEFKRSGDHLHLAAKISDAQIAGLMSAAGGMMGGLGRMH